MTIDKKELAKLSPETRIKRLKSLEEEGKREVDEIGILIKESIRQLKTEKLAEEVAPEQIAVDISRLFEATGEARLEKTVRKEGQNALIKGILNYHMLLQTYEDYSQLKKFHDVVAMGGNLTQDQVARLAEIDERINKAGRYTSESEMIANKLNATRMVLYRLKKETGIG